MKLRAVIVIACLLVFGRPASAHRLDEYLQATMITVAKDHVQVSMRLIPGVAVSSSVIASIDSNGDGQISKAEAYDYVQRVLGDWTLTVNGRVLKPTLISESFPPIEQIKEGVGEIHIEFTAEISPGGSSRKLVFEDRHPGLHEVYLVNSLVPSDPAIQIVSQHRNEQQSFYQLDYLQTGASAGVPSAGFFASARSWTEDIGVSNLFHLGMRHIAEGTDHLLFLLALLLPAPLLACGSRWTGTVSVRDSLLRILKIVTAFTLGHSITLALAAMGFVSVPSRPIEVLIAVSILVSSIHALRPLFPGKEAAIAAFFGLIHGLAFASTLTQLGLGWWQRLCGILAFNIGIETMQLVVVIATLPSLLLLSRTHAYSAFRIAGAVFAGSAAVCWIVERISGVHTPVEIFVNAMAHQAIWIALGLFLFGLVCRWLDKGLNEQMASPKVAMLRE